METKQVSVLPAHQGFLRQHIPLLCEHLTGLEASFHWKRSSKASSLIPTPSTYQLLEKGKLRATERVHLPVFWTGTAAIPNKTRNSFPIPWELWRAQRSSWSNDSMKSGSIMIILPKSRQEPVTPNHLWARNFSKFHFNVLLQCLLDPGYLWWYIKTCLKLTSDFWPK